MVRHKAWRFNDFVPPNLPNPDPLPRAYGGITDTVPLHMLLSQCFGCTSEAVFACGI
jgi:hypothetical protein